MSLENQADQLVVLAEHSSNPHQRALAQHLQETIYDLEARGLIDTFRKPLVGASVKLAMKVSVVGKDLDDEVTIWHLARWKDNSGTPEKWVEMIKGLEPQERHGIMVVLGKVYCANPNFKYTPNIMNIVDLSFRSVPNPDFKPIPDGNLKFIRSSKIEELMKLRGAGLTSAVFLHTAFKRATSI